MGNMNSYKILVGNLKRRDHSENKGVDERKILGGGGWIGFIWLWIETGGGITCRQN
jgi:hypothetical protein